MKTLILTGLILTLSGCGGYHQAKRNGGGAAAAPAPRTISQPIAITPGAQPIDSSGAVITPAAAPAPTPVPTPVPVSKPFATGPIHSACMSSDRKARSRTLCGCIQAVADQRLTGAQQTRAVGFYRDPHSAQVVRTSDRPADERFWETYSNYAQAAKRTCG